jgi:hypothetical protein
LERYNLAKNLILIENSLVQNFTDKIIFSHQYNSKIITIAQLALIDINNDGIDEVFWWWLHQRR